LGEGTVFHIYLPATGVSIKTIDAREEPVKGKGRILLMDDEEVVRHSAAAQLEFLGYQVDLVEDGNKLLKKFTEEKKLGNTYDLVILDLTIPGGMGGEKTMQLLRDIDPNVKAIVSSGYSDNPVMANYQEYGFCGVITKPYLIEELSKEIKRALEGKG
jgi:two-component system cell cycle sensor histidine kinase/response regulator CckA